jgi:hypothetical protein
LTAADPSGSFRRVQRPLARRLGGSIPGLHLFLRPDAFYANPTANATILAGPVHRDATSRRRRRLPPCSSAQPQRERFTTHSPRFFASFYIRCAAELHDRALDLSAALRQYRRALKDTTTLGDDDFPF